MWEEIARSLAAGHGPNNDPNFEDARHPYPQISDDDVVINRALGAAGAEIVPANANVLTHCNAGALACVGYGTALGVIRAAHEQGKRPHVFRKPLADAQTHVDVLVLAPEVTLLT